MRRRRRLHFFVLVPLAERRDGVGFRHQMTFVSESIYYVSDRG